ncbi:EamA family transporter [Microbacteriaceae bacterium VKM Ac-2854]|nr:EamA family transporter [Microbacteriaceae bacterium VKM Ac-2854]
MHPARFTGGVKLPAPSLAIAAMIFVQLGAALSTHLFDALTPAGSTWLRLVVAGVVLLAIARPRLGRIPRRALRNTIILGAVTGLMMLAFIEAVARIPLGTASAIEFLGPLTVAALRSHRRSALLWPALALVGVVLLTQPWQGSLDLIGVAFAVGGALGWAAYILLTQWVGAELEGLQGVAISLSTAAVIATPFGAGAAIAGMTPSILLQGVGIAILVPLLPFVLELIALRRMRVAAFGTLMALEPGIATVLGLIVLAQAPDGFQAVGVLLVIVAGIGAQRTEPMPVAAPATAAAS